MKIYLELNHRHQCGYQVHVIDGPLNMTDDEEAMTLADATQDAIHLIEAVNERDGRSLKPWEVIHITDEALQANQHDDIQSYKIMQDIKSGAHELTQRVTEPEEYYLTGPGVVLYSYFVWIEEQLPKARTVLERYCELLACKGYGGGANDILSELDRKEKDKVEHWVQTTFGKFIDDSAAAINYMFRGLKEA